MTCDYLIIAFSYEYKALGRAESGALIRKQRGAQNALHNDWVDAHIGARYHQRPRVFVHTLNATI